MPGKQDTSILIVDADESVAQKIGMALDGAGFKMGWCAFGPRELAATLSELQPDLVLAHAEFSSPQLSSLLTRLEAVGMPDLPIALLCRDLGEEAFVRPMKTSVVELLGEPFSPRLHVGRLRILLAELPERPGKLRGRGGPQELSGLVQHVTRARRTGGLVVGNQEEGTAFFLKGTLKSARHGTLNMQPALAAITRLELPWTFVEGVEGGGVVDMGEEMEIEQLEHGVPVRAAEGSNTAARLELERLAAPSPAPQPERPVARGVGTPAAALTLDPDAAKTPLLFVDDEAAVVKMLADYFGKKGYPVATASDGVEAMSLLSAHPFEAVIADLNMPRLDGWGLLRLLREDFRTREVPVALFSAQDNYRESLRLLHAGAQAYFPKTVKLAALESQVKEMLEPRRRFQRLISSEGAMAFDFGALGPQWIVKALTQANFDGEVEARDAWAAWRLWFEDGRLVQATAHMSTTTVSGDRALVPFLASKNAEGTLAHGSRPFDEGFAGHGTMATLARLVPWINDEQRRAREAELAKAKALTVQEDLYQLYLTVGPPAWMPIVRLLCEAKLPPAEVMARLQVTPMEVAAVVKDLLRRGVANLQA
jgi:DNA-binding response OmpR family regulator